MTDMVQVRKFVEELGGYADHLNANCDYLDELYDAIAMVGELLTKQHDIEIAINIKPLFAVETPTDPHYLEQRFKIAGPVLLRMLKEEYHKTERHLVDSVTRIKAGGYCGEGGQ